MDKTPFSFVTVRTGVGQSPIANLRAILHLIRIHDGANQFAIIDQRHISPDILEMLFESDSSMRHRSRYDYSPLYDNDVATLLAVAGVEVISRDRLTLVVKNQIKELVG